MFYINGSESKNGENLSRKEEKKSWNQSGKEKAKKGENVSCFPINCGAFSLVFTHEVSASPQHRVSHKKRRLWGKHQLKRYSVKVLVTQSCLTLCNPMVQPTRLLCPWDSPGNNTGVGGHSLLQGIFPTQGSNARSPILQADCLPSEPPGVKEVLNTTSESQLLLLNG